MFFNVEIEGLTEPFSIWDMYALVQPAFSDKSRSLNPLLCRKAFILPPNVLSSWISFMTPLPEFYSKATTFC
jgi:hypothetical protein